MASKFYGITREHCDYLRKCVCVSICECEAQVCYVKELQCDQDLSALYEVTMLKAVSGKRIRLL